MAGVARPPPVLASASDMSGTVRPNTRTQGKVEPGGGVTTRPRIAVAHDWLCGLRGGELVLDRVLEVLAREGVQLAGLYTMFADGAPLTRAIDDAPKTVSRPGRLPLASTRLRRWMLPLYPRMVEELSARLAEEHARRKIDLLISTSSAAIKGMRAPAQGTPPAGAVAAAVEATL